MTIKKSDFIIIDYTGRVKETGNVFDTTSEKVAKEEKLYKEGDIYEPKLVVVGEGWVLKALDEALITFKIKKTNSVEIAPEKAFGLRDPEKLKLVPIRRLVARGLTPRLGAQIEYDKRLATVRTMGSGRVTLDFNPPLAGKTLVYEVTVQNQLRTTNKKISALIHRRIPAVEVEKFTFTVDKSNLTINVPEEAFYIEGLQLAKRGITLDIQRFLPELTGTQFVEIFGKSETTTEPKKKLKKKAAKKQPKRQSKKTEKKPAKKTTKTGKKAKKGTD